MKLNSQIIGALKIEDDLGVTLRNMNTSSDEVLTGSNQMAEGSQSLATAEETAASCEELSGQSKLLKDQVARFRINQ